MTPERRAAETANKRAERQRRREAGEVRVEVWFDVTTLARLDRIAKKLDVSRGPALQALVWEIKE